MKQENNSIARFGKYKAIEEAINDYSVTSKLNQKTKEAHHFNVIKKQAELIN
jgi:hydroxymethylglutaryl-CoA reductase